MKPNLPTFEAGGTTFVVVPATLAAKHGLLDDAAAARRRSLGKRLRRARLAAKLTQVELAERLGSSQPSISAVEAGREPCSEDRAAAWLDACGSTAGKGRR